MRCEVAIAMLCYNANLQTEINKKLWGKKLQTRHAYDWLQTGRGREGGREGYYGFPGYFSANELPRNGGGRLNPYPNPFLLRRN